MALSMKKTEFVCKNCQVYFDSLQACLRHDLLKHISFKRINVKNPHIAKLQQIWTFFDNEEYDRQKVHDVLNNCKPGQELHELIKIYCLDNEKIDEALSQVVSCLQEDLQPLKNIDIRTFGSIDNGLMMKNSDIDIYARTGQSKNFYRNSTYYQIVDLLRHGKHFADVVPIPQARIPIIKCRHVDTNFKIDINCACPDSVENTKFVREVLGFDIRLRTLMRFIKIWAKQHRLIGQGLMTCYCLTTLVLFFLQQMRYEKESLIPSVQKMQSDEPSMLVQGINYAFNIYKHMVPLPADLHTNTLIRDFFTYYHEFDFRRLMVATHLGVTVSLADFRSGKFHYAAYENQLTILKTTGFKAKIKPLCIERDMVIQDSFQLNQNLAKSVTQAHFNYFRQCIENAFRVCSSAPDENYAKLYEALLFDLSHVEAPKAESIMCKPAAKQASSFICNLMPKKVELETVRQRECKRERERERERKVVSLTNVQCDAPHRQRVLRTIELICTVFKKIYCLDVQVCSDSEESVHFGCTEPLNATMVILDEKGSCSWIITGSVDMWSGRKYRCVGTQTFVKYQQLLTKALMLERSKMSEFAVDFNVCLAIHANGEDDLVKLEFTQNSWSEAADDKKTTALQKFIENFKCIMHSLNVEERSNVEANAI